jgi:hypothetical protein
MLRVLMFAALVIVVFPGSRPMALAADEPPAKVVVPAPPMTAQAKISAAIEFDIAAMDRALERHVPKRLADFNDHKTRCWHRRMFRREVDIACEYSGLVERTGPISLHAERGRLEAAIPVYGAVSGQGIGRFARLLHGAGEGALTIYAAARPRLRPDWTVALDMSEGFRWREPPVLRILGFEINVSRYVEPAVRRQIERVQADAAAYIRGLDLRDKAETAWRQAFSTIKIFDSPEIWLQMTPQTVAFSGLRAQGSVLEGALELAGTTATTIGAEPAAQTPTPLPALGADVDEPGHFEFIIPVVIGYDAIRARIADAAAAVNGAGFTVRDIQIYPAGDKVVAGLRLAAADSPSTDGDWVYLTATPRPSSQDQTLQFPDLALSTAARSTSPALADWFKDEGHLQALRSQLRLGYQDKMNEILASANARLTRSLGHGFRSDAHLTSAGIAGIQPLDDGIRIDIRTSGHLKILYGL